MKSNLIETGLCAYSVRYMPIDCSEALATAQRLHNLNPHACTRQAMLLVASYLPISKERNASPSKYSLKSQVILAEAHCGTIRAKMTPADLPSYPSSLQGYMLA